MDANHEYRVHKDVADAIVRYESALGKAWVYDCSEEPGDRRLREHWLKVTERHKELLAAIKKHSAAVLAEKVAKLAAPGHRTMDDLMRDMQEICDLARASMNID